MLFLFLLSQPSFLTLLSKNLFHSWQLAAAWEQVLLLRLIASSSHSLSVHAQLTLGSGCPSLRSKALPPCVARLSQSWHCASWHQPRWDSRGREKGHVWGKIRYLEALIRLCGFNILLLLCTCQKNFCSCLLSQVSTFTIQPSTGKIPPLGQCTVSVQFTSLQCQRLQTVLELEVENGKGR